MNPRRLTAKQWMRLVRSHWGVENENHHTLDTAFAEDHRPWIEADANGMLAVLLLRRMAYTLLALYRAVTLRAAGQRAMRWKALLAWVRDALVAAAPEHTMLAVLLIGLGALAWRQGVIPRFRVLREDARWIKRYDSTLAETIHAGTDHGNDSFFVIASGVWCF